MVKKPARAVRPAAISYSEQDRASDYHDVFSTPQGQRVLADLMAFCHAWQPFVINQDQVTDPISIGIYEGERNVGCRIATYMGYNPVDFPRVARQLTDEIQEDDVDDYGTRVQFYDDDDGE